MIIVKQIDIINKLGLHARASSKLVELAKSFNSTITIKKNNKVANAKSLLSVMMLAVSFGSKVEFSCDGDDSELAMIGIEAIINNKFGEGI